MAANMKTIFGALLLLLCVLQAAGASEILQDPTRPPAEIGAGTGSSIASRSPPPTMKGLLSVIISPSRCAAIIDGKTIKLGGKYGNATLVEITPKGVLLRGANGIRNMGLFPGVGVKVITQDAVQKSVTCKLENQKIEQKVTRQSGSKEKK
jgi:MSHA biogenesis protein MshK